MAAESLRTFRHDCSLHPVQRHLQLATGYWSFLLDGSRGIAYSDRAGEWAAGNLGWVGTGQGGRQAGGKAGKWMYLFYNYTWQCSRVMGGRNPVDMNLTWSYVGGMYDGPFGKVKQPCWEMAMKADLG